jgi:CubicO group peptidase (beta-lactamase class C family)
MENTFFQIPENKYARAISYYLHQNDQFIEQPGLGKEKPNELSGGGNLLSTAEDYAKFLKMLLNKGTAGGIKILSSNSVDEMTKNQIGDLFVETQETAMPMYSNSFPVRSGKDKFGFSFLITSNIDNPPFTRKPGSYSWGGLFNTYFWVDPSSGISAVILMQMLPFFDKDCVETVSKFEEIIYRNLEEK